MNSSYVNLIKLSVGTDSVEGLESWQAMRRAALDTDFSYHVTRMWPKREAEIVSGGSIYWVIKGMIQCRQRIVALEEIFGEDGVRRCAIMLDPEVIRTQSTPRRAFQGWRYLAADDAPPDLPTARVAEEPLPEELSRALSEIGLL